MFSATGLVLITVISYILGLIFDFFTYQLVRLLRGKHFIEEYFADFVAQHKNLDIKFQTADWSILHAKLGLENTQVGDAVEHGNVTNHMLRNLSLGFFLFAFIQGVEFIFEPTPLRIGLTLFFVFLSFFAQKQSTKFPRLFYLQIFEYTVAKDFSDLKCIEYKLPGNLTYQAEPNMEKLSD